MLIGGILIASFAPTAGADMGRNCYSSKLRIAQSYARDLAKCYVRVAKKGAAFNLAGCEAVVLAKANNLLGAIDRESLQGDFVCPGDATTLALAGATGWQQQIQALQWALNTLPNGCVAARAKEIGKYASSYGGCLSQLYQADAATVSLCAGRPTARFEANWYSAAAYIGCLGTPAAEVSAAIRAAIDTQALVVTVRCGDGVAAGVELCDDGDLDEFNGCRSNCTLPFCGDGIVDPDEGCDDANSDSNDACTNACLPAVCGDGIVQHGVEECDGGIANSDVVPDACRLSCVLAACGDGVIDSHEQCEDGNLDDLDGCRNDCTIPNCGDGITGAGETCDDTNLDNRDACLNACRAASCGDGFIYRDFEECDDGGTIAGDGCSATCLREECGRVGADVRCLVCPSGASPDATFTTCACDPGFVPEGAGCRDIDECATATAACAPDSPCVNVPGSYSCSTACTQEAFHAALASCGAPTGVITFACNDTTILVDAAAGSDPRRTSCNGLVIDGLDRDITFAMNPPCYEIPVAPSQCNEPLVGGLCACPNRDAGTGFLALQGDDSTVRNLTVRNFYEGIHTSGRNNTVEAMEFVRMCDDALTNDFSGVGNLFEDLTVREGCDKCSQSDGDMALTEAHPALREHYNAIYRNVDFIGCDQPIRATNGGRFLVDRCRMREQFAPYYRCLGPRFSSDESAPQVLHFFDSDVDGCARGLRIGGNAEALVAHNSFTGGGFRGVLLRASARAALWNNIITGNGGLGSSEPGLGGVAVTDSAVASLGGGSVMVDGEAIESPGGNVICGNIKPNGSPQEVQNLATTSLMAEDNWWCTGDPASRVTGTVDVSPFLLSPP